MEGKNQVPFLFVIYVKLTISGEEVEVDIEKHEKSGR
jgi:predicted RNA-binding protein with TRAM domain